MVVLDLKTGTGEHSLAAGGQSTPVQRRIDQGKASRCMPSDFVPILIFAVVAVAVAAIAVLVPALFGPKRPTKVKLAPYILCPVSSLPYTFYPAILALPQWRHAKYEAYSVSYLCTLHVSPSTPWRLPNGDAPKTPSLWVKSH